MLTMIEINEMRIKEQKLLSKQHEANTDFIEASKRNLADLDEQEKKTHDDLVKRIGKHFKGIIPYVIVSNTQLIVGFNEAWNLTYRHGSFTWNTITSKLAHTIKEDYEEVFGEPKKS
jgi:hypothetical protein